MAESRLSEVENESSPGISFHPPLNKSSSSERNVYKGSLRGLKVAIIKTKKNHAWRKFISKVKTRSEDTICEDYKLTEFEILQDLRHENIIRQFNVLHDEDFIYIPMELCDKNLEEYCMNSKYDKTKRLNILEQIGKGIEYLHNLTNPIVHGDLNPRNILIINSDGNNVTVKITDFRTSVVMDCIEIDIGSIHIASDDIGCPYSKPPEALGENVAVEVTPAWDIYAYGCLIQTVLTKDPNKMHPYGNMTNGSFKNDVINGNRKYYLEESDSETDLFILANLAIHDATQKDSWKRPTIKTLLNHPMYWNLRHKEMLFRDFYRDYMSYKADKKLVDWLNRVFCARYQEGLLGQQFEPVSRLFRNRPKGNQTSNVNKTQYDFLINIIRNTGSHRGENLRKHKDEEIVQLFGKSAFDCIANFIKKFPYVFWDIIVCYRKKVREYAERLDFLNDNYHDYFKHYAEDFMPNKVTWEGIPREIKAKNVQKFLKENENFTDCAKIEWCLRSLSLDISKNFDFCKNILTNNLPLMDKNYHECVVLELENYELKGNINIVPSKSQEHGCRYNLFEILYIGSLLNKITIDGSKCHHKHCTHSYKFDIDKIQLEADLHWQLRYKTSDSVIKFRDLNCGNYISLGEILREGRDLKLYHKKSGCSYNFLDVVHVDFGRLNQSLIIEGNQCLDAECKENVHKYFFDMRSLDGISGGYHWWLEFKGKDGKSKMYSFVAMDMEKLTDIFKLGNDVILHRSSKMFEGDASVATIQEDGNIQKDILAIYDDI